jgi:hypothetical protein
MHLARLARTLRGNRCGNRCDALHTTSYLHTVTNLHARSNGYSLANLYACSADRHANIYPSTNCNAVA